MRNLLIGLLAGVILGGATVTVAAQTNRFSDVPAGHYAEDAIAWAVANGITTA